MIKHILFSGTAALALLATCAMAHAQSIDTRIGKLELHNGYPSMATVEKLYDEMDFQRATQAFLWALPAVGFHGLHLAHRNTFGAKDGEVVLCQSLQLGLLMSFGMVLHYVVGAQYPTGEQFLKNVTLWYACPWTLSTAVVLGGALGMMAVGAIYAILGKQAPTPRVEGLEKAALPLCTLALIAMFLTGYVGYFVVDARWPTFYYAPLTEGKNVWLSMQLACMVLYAVGVCLAVNGLRRASHALA